MSLDVYEYSPYPDGDAISKNGVMNQPLEVILPEGHQSSAIQLFICTADASYYYTDITVTPVDVEGPTDEADWIELSADGTSWQPAGGALTGFGTVGPGAAVYETFYARLTAPSGEDAQIKTDLRFKLSYTKHAVPT